MTTYVLRNGRLVPKHLAAPLIHGRNAPNVISDQMEAQSMADGRTYTSKRAYERSLRDHGCHVVTGMDPRSYVAPKDYGGPVETDVKRALQELYSR